MGRKREIDLKTELGFQEYHHGVEKEYEIKRIQLGIKETAARDLEAQCKSIEATISAFHREKMDEVNKNLQSIWKEVYHGDDILKIEVQAAF